MTKITEETCVLLKFPGLKILAKSERFEKEKLELCSWNARKKWFKVKISEKSWACSIKRLRASKDFGRKCLLKETRAILDSIESFSEEIEWMYEEKLSVFLVFMAGGEIFFQIKINIFNYYSVLHRIKNNADKKYF